MPLGLQNIFIRQHHADIIHAIFPRLLHHFDFKYAWAERGEAKKFAKVVMGDCVVWQKCTRPTRFKICIEHTPIPPALMYSVSPDMFQLHKFTYLGSEYDCMVVCVDLNSGWIVAILCLYRGLTGAKVANLMLD